MSPQASTEQQQLVTFLRRHDYVLVRELGQGACGKTVLLHDDIIDELFVCKKYAPQDDRDRSELFEAFVREVKILHKLSHPNIVRVFNHHLYREMKTGYIVMEYVDGADVDDAVADRPEHINDLFVQAIAGFAYLERMGVLHRDIRPANLMVTSGGSLKIIDFGFGKRVHDIADFDKSISLNWWCEPPWEFSAGRYDFSTEVYFVGKLFEQLIQQNGIRHFKFLDVLSAMCQRSAEHRAAGFTAIETRLGSDQFGELPFTEAELHAYRAFSDAVFRHITKIESGAKYVTDVEKVTSALNDVYQRVMLEGAVSDSSIVLGCLLHGPYYYKKTGFPVEVLRNFVALLRSAVDERSRIIMANLHTKLDAVPRYDWSSDDDIPF